MFGYNFHLVQVVILRRNMSTPSVLACGICFFDAEAPAALLCGHIFCAECIERVIKAVHPSSNVHACPKCHSSFTMPDPHAEEFCCEPPPLQQGINAPVLRIFPDSQKLYPRTIPSATEMAIENARLHAENTALQSNCELWRKRASAQAS